MNINDSNKSPLTEEFLAWWTYVQQDPIARINRFLPFAASQGWLPPKLVRLLVIYGLGLITLSVWSFATELSEKFSVLTKLTSIGTGLALAYFEYQIWYCSRLVFLVTLVLLGIPTIFLVIATNFLGV